MNKLFEEMEEEQSSNIENLEQNDLTTVASLAKKQKNQEQKVKDLDAELKEAKKELLRISDEEIPNLMTETGLSSFKLDDGSSLEIKNIYGASILVANREKAYDWLRDHGHDDIIKNKVVATFGRGQEEDAKVFMRVAYDNGVATDQESKIEPQTLKAWVKERMEAGEEFPMELFGAFIGQRAIIKGMTTAVEEKKKSEVAMFDASMMEADAGSGINDLGSDDLALPFLKILSGLDSKLDDLDNAKRGDIINSVTDEVYKGKEGVDVIPCAYERVYIQWAPRGEGSGAPSSVYKTKDECPEVERSSEDNKDYLTDGSGQYIEETHQHYVLILKDDGSADQALIAMKSTQLKKSRKWNSMMLSATIKGKNGMFTPPRFGFIYHLKSVGEENSKGSWHGWEMSRKEPVSSADVYAKAKAFAESIKKGGVVVKHEKDDIPF